MTIDITRLSRKEQFFAWKEADKPVRNFATGRLAAYLKGVKWPVVMIEITAPLLNQVIERNGVEPEQVAKVSAQRLNEPIIIFQHEDATHTLADGNHRVVARVQHGFVDAPSHIVPPSVWMRFEITGMSDNPAFWEEFMRTNFSRLKG